MTNPEHKEHPNSSPKGPLKVEKQLTNLENRIELNGLRFNILGQQLEYKNLSKDGKYEVYSYTIDYRGTMPSSIKIKTQLQLQLKSNNGIKITDRNGNEYPENSPIEKGKKVYIKVPKKRENNESENELIDRMKCKGGEYFGIDVSKFNAISPLKGETDEHYEKRVRNRRNQNYSKKLKEFKKYNRDSWDSKKKDTRGVSFIYIRAGEGTYRHPKADKLTLEKWINFIHDYNNDETVKNNHEQISTGLYWTLSLKKGNTGTSEAKDFINIYNQYLKYNKLGGNRLIPMLDVETSTFNKNPKEAKKRMLQWLKYVEAKTGIIPGLYIGAAVYGNYIKNDREFDKYKDLIRIAAYGDRTNLKKGTVEVGTQNNKSTINPAMYQSSEHGRVPGTGNGNNHTDMDHTKDITKLFSKNNRSK